MNTNRFSKFFFSALLGIAAYGLSACTADIIENGKNENGQTAQTLSIEVITPSAVNKTRAGYATSGETIKESFVEGDEIGVYGMNGSELIANNVKFTLNAEGHWMPESDVTYSYDYTYYAYYPYKSNATLTSQSCSFDSSSAPVYEDLEGQAYDDTPDKFASFITHWPIATDQSDVDDFMASDLLAARGSNLTVPVVRFTMAHRLAMCQLVPSYNYWYLSNDQTTSTGRKTMGVVFEGNIPYELDGNFYYIMRPEQSTTVGGQTVQASTGKYYYKRLPSITGSYTLKYSTNGGSTFVDSKPSWINIAEKDGGSENKEFVVSYNYTSTASVGTTLPSGTVSDYDLSTHDVNGNSCSRTTANSYMIHKGGTYKLPLVYGNSIKNGATNTQAFSPSGTGADFLSPFVSALGNNITDPWIKTVDGTPTTAVLLWQDANRVVTAVGISGDYLTFTVPESAPCGNALIAVKNSSDKILWSWHIWACPDWYKSTSMTKIKSGDVTYNVCPVNLGWVGTFTKNSYSEASCIVKVIPDSGTPLLFTVNLPQTEEYIPTARGYCPYYQWGRKDPEQPSTGSANTPHAVYDVSGNSGTALTHSSTAVSISTTIQNPTIHYYNSSNYGPYSTNEYNLWDAYETTVTNSGNKTGHTVKTIYDPCPPGYCVPRGNLYYKITSGGTQTGYAIWDGTTAMRSWTQQWPAIFFPAAGYRNYSSGTSFNYVTSYGFCWSSSAYSSAGGRHLGFYSSTFYWSYGYRAYGFSVRPVLEE